MISHKCKERHTLMMSLTQITRWKRCVNIPCSKKVPTNISISVEDAQSHTNTTTKHTRMLMMSLCAKKAQESVVTNICIWGIRNTQTPKRSTQINRPIIPRSNRRHSQTLVVPPNSLFLHHLNSPFVLHTQMPNPFGYTCTVLKIHSTIFAIIMNTTMEN